MERLDIAYLAELVVKAQNGGSNAFAELYTATYQREYSYAYQELKSEEKAKEALKATYVRALKEIKKLNEPELCISWLTHINFEICQGIKAIEFLEKGFDINEMNFDDIKIDGKKYRIAQLSKNLPMTEAQLLIMKYYQHYTMGEIRRRLGLKFYEAKATHREGLAHLKQLLQE